MSAKKVTLLSYEVKSRVCMAPRPKYTNIWGGLDRGVRARGQGVDQDIINVDYSDNKLIYRHLGGCVINPAWSVPGLHVHPYS